MLKLGNFYVVKYIYGTRMDTNTISGEYGGIFDIGKESFIKIIVGGSSEYFINANKIHTIVSTVDNRGE